MVKSSQGVRRQIGQPQEAKEASQENSSEDFWRFETITGQRYLFKHVKVNGVMRYQGPRAVDSDRFQI